ncbi:hypothetical protein [Treponema sp. C6A8]|uniref:hypothetical protein n=1 Tax=Treponema sp. C6A8 TaxID=1410609 RepID=UPI0004817B95|nr:hypothetical protein [Treponema sp. C6A8]
MREEEFFDWLVCSYPEKVAHSRFSNCKRVEEYEENLDVAYDNDQCIALLNRLNYTKTDAKNHAPARHSIPINGDIYNGTATLKTAVKLYISFLEGDESAKRSSRKSVVSPKNSGKKGNNNFPEWEQPLEEESYQLAQVITKYVRFLNPEIIARIAEENEKVRVKLSKALENRNIDASLYLWEKSPCCFPGVRRHAGSSEIAMHRKRMQKTEIEDALELDSNAYPKQLWSYIFRGKKYGNFGPKEYNLAHLVDHKFDGNRMTDEFDYDIEKYQKPLFGLYSSAANSAYVPAALMKPTDFNGYLRNLLFQKMYDLYGSVCNVLPADFKLKAPVSQRWDFKNFQWAEPVGTLEFIDDFLAFRKAKMNELFGEEIL